MSGSNICFIDANFIISIFKMEEFGDKCNRILDGSKYKFHTSDTSIGEIFRVLKTDIPKERRESVFKEVNEILLNKIKHVGEPKKEKLLEIIENGTIKNGWQDHISKADIRHVCCAIENDCDMFITQDGKLYKQATTISQISYKESENYNESKSKRRLKIIHPRDVDIN